MKTFLLDCENLFNLTPLDATNIIETLRDEIEKEPNAKANYYADLDIEVEVKRLTDNILTARITGCSSLDVFHDITNKIKDYVSLCLSKIR